MQEPAFPTERNLTQGMTLRDYFAAKAMQALVAREDWDTETDFYSTWAYEMADSMMEARE